jgi:hypothetical protein
VLGNATVDGKVVSTTGYDWFSPVETVFLDRLPPLVSTIIRLGGKNDISIVRESKHNFAVYYRNKFSADITDLLRCGWDKEPVKIRLAVMIARSEWLADHWGVPYSRVRGGKQRKKKPRRGCRRG